LLSSVLLVGVDVSVVGGDDPVPDFVPDVEIAFDFLLHLLTEFNRENGTLS
jgi:hypothetical protein